VTQNDERPLPLLDEMEMNAVDLDSAMRDVADRHITPPLLLHAFARQKLDRDKRFGA